MRGKDEEEIGAGDMLTLERETETERDQPRSPAKHKAAARQFSRSWVEG